MSALVPVAVDTDPDSAQAKAGMALGEVPRWMTLQNAPPTALDASTAAVFRNTMGGYHMSRHRAAGGTDTANSPVGGTFSAEVVGEQRVAGDPDTVIERIRPLLDLGLERIIVTLEPTFVECVLPALLSVRRQGDLARLSLSSKQLVMIGEVGRNLWN